jgi:hypothetical protein
MKPPTLMAVARHRALDPLLSEMKKQKQALQRKKPAALPL